MKKLSEMSLEELWQLFPIFLTEHRTQWQGWFDEEALLLKGALPQNVRISHIGSTAIPGIWAKPIIDILVEAGADELPACGEAIRRSGYICMAQGKTRMSFNKGYTPEGFAERVYHVHLRCAGDNDELYFRDFLREHQDEAMAYEELKLGLWKTFEHDRDGYTAAKASFVGRITAKAKELYGEKY